MKKTISLVLVLALAASLFAIPASADAYATARTPLFDAATARGANVERAAGAVNRIQVKYGETFSFNAVVGPRTSERGYCNAVNGRGVTVAGGGVAQVATTLYLALVNLRTPDIAYTDLTTYGRNFTGDYVNDGSQAVVTDYAGDIDFAFVNYAADELDIEMWISNDYLYCSVALSDSDETWMDATAGSGSQNIWGGGWNNNWNAPRQLARSELYCGADTAVLANVALAAESIYDTTLTNGDVFSFNAIVGPRESRYGYVVAVNGRGVKVTGGGVAQVASAIWLAIKDLDDVSIIEKSTYGNRYNQSYVDSSADAILTDYNAGTDFAFRYTGSGSITLYPYLSGSTLICTVEAG